MDKPHSIETSGVIDISRGSHDEGASDWRITVPELVGRRVTLREPRATDATALLSLLSTEEVSRFSSPPPATLDGFQRYVSWTHRQRAAGQLHFALRSSQRAQTPRSASFTCARSAQGSSLPTGDSR